MALKRKEKSGALCFRIFTFSTLMAIMICGAIEPKHVHKVTAELVTIIVVAIAMAVQFYVTVAKFLPFPYHICVVIAADAVCALGFIAAIGMLSYWNINILYTPRDTDPASWLECHEANEWYHVLTSSGLANAVNIVWCDIDLDGQHRLVGNITARRQLHVLLGLSVVCLLFTGMTIVHTVFRAIYMGDIHNPKFQAKLRNVFS